MSDYISGQEIVDEYEILPFEFLNRFIHRGLVPLGPQSDQPVKVSQLLTAVLNIQEMADNNDPALEHYNNFIDANSKTDWPDFQLSGDAEIDQKINDALLEHVYDRKLYKKLEALDQMQRHGHPEPQPGIKAEPAMAANVEPSNRPSKEHKEKCQERAKRIWEIYPNMHQKQLSEYEAFRLQIVMKDGAKEYDDETYKKWITDLWPVAPEKRKGPSWKLDVSNEEIEVLLKDFY